MTWNSAFSPKSKKYHKKIYGVKELYAYFARDNLPSLLAMQVIQ
jgi:hypothetical protein